MAIDGISPLLAGLKSIKPVEGLSQPGKIEAPVKGGFQAALQEAIGEVDRLQIKANGSIEDLVLGKNGVTTHDAMIALEKADTAFTLMNNIRAKIIRAYEEVIRTQV